MKREGTEVGKKKQYMVLSGQSCGTGYVPAAGQTA